MFERMIVPTDGSDYSWRAVRVGEALARQCDAELELLEVVDYRDRRQAGRATHDEPARGRGFVCADARCAPAFATFRRVHDRRPRRRVTGATTVMSTSGRGRSEAILGSVAVDILNEM